MPDATPPRPLTAPDVVAGLLADVAERDERLAELTAERDKAYRERAHLVAHLAACHPSVMLTDSAEPDWPIVFVSTSAGQMSWHIAKADLELFGHVPATTEPTWDGHTTEEKYRRLAELVRTLSYLGPPEQVDASIAEGKLDKALAANQRWAETLGDVQQRHAEVKRERDAHKLRADHYEGLWRAEHGLSPDGTGDLARDRDLAASVRAVIARYRDDGMNALTAFADIMDAFADSGRVAGQAAPTAVDVPALMKDHVRLGAELRELTRVHETLLEEILRNADEDINGGDEAAEYLAEAYVRFLEGSLKSASDERDKLSGACGLLARTLSMYVRSLYATWIDAAQHRNLTAVIEVLAESLDGFDGPEWNGSETGTEWLERTRGADVVSEALSENEDDGTKTASVLANPETMAAIAEGDQDLAGDIATRGLDHWEGQHDDD